MTSIRCFAILLLSSIGLLSASARAADLTVDDVLGVINEKHLSTLEELLPELPLDLRSSFALVHDSRSTQGATFDKPRVILYGKTGRFVTAFNGDPALPGHENLEMIQFNEQESAFEFYRLTFPLTRGADGKVARPEKNPSKCLGCHGSVPHPIWNAYNNWPGVYGTNDDFIEGAERTSLQQFLATRSAHERYRYLAPMPGSGLSPYSFEKRGNLQFRPNVRLGAFFSRLGAKALARRIRDTGRFPKFASLFAYELERLGNIDTETICDKLTGASPIYGGLWTPADGKLLHDSLEAERAAVAPSLAPIPMDWDLVRDLSPMFTGIGINAWSLSLETDTAQFTEFAYGNGPIRDLVLGELANDVVATLPGLAPFVGRHSRLGEDSGVQRYTRTPFDVEFFRTLDGDGESIFFKSKEHAQCQLLLADIKKQWLSAPLVGASSRGSLSF